MNPEILDLLQQLFPNDHIILNREYASKKNMVALITINDKARIVKWFKSDNQKAMEQEIHILENIPNHLNVPTVINVDKDHHLVFMKYINGENLCDVVHDKSVSFQSINQLMKTLAEWFAIFHKTMKKEKIFLLRGDAHIRNFIVSDHRIWGFDFEEVNIGNPSKDIAELCVSILLTHPLFTNSKLSWCHHFIETYNTQVSWTLENFQTIFYKHIDLVKKRRIESDVIDKLLVKKKDELNQLFL